MSTTVSALPAALGALGDAADDSVDRLRPRIPRLRDALARVRPGGGADSSVVSALAQHTDAVHALGLFVRRVGDELNAADGGGAAGGGSGGGGLDGGGGGGGGTGAVALPDTVVPRTAPVGAVPLGSPFSIGDVAVPVTAGVLLYTPGFDAPVGPSAPPGSGGGPLQESPGDHRVPGNGLQGPLPGVTVIHAKPLPAPAPVAGPATPPTPVIPDLPFEP